MKRLTCRGDHAYLLTHLPPYPRVIQETATGTARLTARWAAHPRKGRNNTMEDSVFKGRQDRTAREKSAPPVIPAKEFHPWPFCISAVLSCAIFTNLEGHDLQVVVTVNDSHT